MSDTIEKFQSFGEGVYFYFYFLKYFTTVFFLMVLFTIPIIVIIGLSDGAGFKADQNFIVRTSLSNFFKLQIEDGQTQIQINQQKSDFEERSSLYFYIFQGLDLGYSLFLLIAIVVFKITISKKRKNIDKETLTVQKYTLLVTKIPKNATVDDLKAFFGQFAEIVHVNAMFKFKGSLPDILKAARMELKRKEMRRELRDPDLKPKKKMELQKKLSKLASDQNKLIQSIRKQIGIKNNQPFDLRTFQGIPILQAYVTFKSVEDLKRTYQLFKRAYNRGCCCKRPKNQKFYFNGRKLKMKTPDLPSNMNWENIEFTNCRRFFRFFIFFVIIVILLAISTALVLGLTSIRESAKNTISATGDDCVKVIAVDHVKANSDTMTEAEINCFCASQSKVSIASDSAILKVCGDFLTAQALTYAKQFGSAFLISILDVLFAILIFKIIKIVDFIISYSSKLKKTFYFLF